MRSFILTAAFTLGATLAHAQTYFLERSLGFEYALMALSVGGAIASWAIARSRYGEKSGRCASGCGPARIR